MKTQQAHEICIYSVGTASFLEAQIGDEHLLGVGIRIGLNAEKLFSTEPPPCKIDCCLFQEGKVTVVFLRFEFVNDRAYIYTMNACDGWGGNERMITELANGAPLPVIVFDDQPDPICAFDLPPCPKLWKDLQRSLSSHRLWTEEEFRAALSVAVSDPAVGEFLTGPHRVVAISSEDDLDRHEDLLRANQVLLPK